MHSIHEEGDNDGPPSRDCHVLHPPHRRNDAGSVNPFILGAERTSKKRSYTAFIDFGPIPSTRAPNTLYTGTGQGGTPNFDGTFIYRVYVPDRGLDELGGVGVPTVTLETTSGQKPPPPARTGFSPPAPA